MIIKQISETPIAYLRNTGPYGEGNEKLMTEFKRLLAKENQLTDQSVILGIALDNPATTVPDRQRYEVGLVVKANTEIPELAYRVLPTGTYAIIEVPHTVEGVTGFWRNLAEWTKELSVDWEQPIIERYAAVKLDQHRCEFCVPLKN